MEINYFKESLKFKFPAGTSRGVLLNKPSWVFHLKDEPLVRGECSIIPGLSPDYHSEEEYEQKIRWVCETFNKLIKSENQQRVLSFFCEELKSFPSILFGIETLIFNFNLDKGENPFKSPFSEGNEGILIKGIIWMGSEDSRRHGQHECVRADEHDGQRDQCATSHAQHERHDANRQNDQRSKFTFWIFAEMINLLSTC